MSYLSWSKASFHGLAHAQLLFCSTWKITQTIENASFYNFTTHSTQPTVRSRGTNCLSFLVGDVEGGLYSSVTCFKHSCRSFTLGFQLSWFLQIQQKDLISLKKIFSTCCSCCILWSRVFSSWSIERNIGFLDGTEDTGRRKGCRLRKWSSS